MQRLLARRRAEKAQESFETGLLRLLEGNWKRAEIELVRRAADHHAGHLNYLAAARAAQRPGAGDRRDHYLKLASEIAPEMRSEEHTSELQSLMRSPNAVLLLQKNTKLYKEP